MASHERGETYDSLTIMFVSMFVLVLAREQAAVCASPTLKRSVRKYNYSEDVRVNETADGTARAARHRPGPNNYNISS
jgi:hypothetical protein